MGESIVGMKAFSITFFIVCLMTVSGLIVTASANPVPIISYDLEGIPEPGCGGWSHTYSTARQDTGRRVCCQAFGAGCATPPVALLNYFGGTGTLNNGTISTSVNDTMLVDFQEYGTRRVQKHGTPGSRPPSVTRWGG